MSTRGKPKAAKVTTVTVKPKKDDNTVWAVLGAVALAAAAAWLISMMVNRERQAPQAQLQMLQPQGQASVMALSQAQAGQAQADQAQAAQAAQAGQAQALLQYSCDALPQALQGQCRERKTQMMANGQCAELAEVDPVAGSVCHDLFRYGFYPKPLSYSVNPNPIVPSNFADQYAANQPVQWQKLMGGPAQADGQWTMDLNAYDNKGLDQASAYQSNLRTPTWREAYWNPGALQGPRASGASSDVDTVTALPLM